MHKLRLFIAIDIPDNVKEQLLEVQTTLRHVTSNVKWVAFENLHLTLKFLGETEASQSTKIINAMQEIAKETAPFALHIAGLGTFPGRGRPKVVWAGVGGQTNQLLALQKRLEKQLEQVGYPKESRQYSPHLTLGRPREFGELGSFTEQLGKYQTHLFGHWEITSIKLIQSTLRPTGPIYTVLADSPLGTV